MAATKWSSLMGWIQLPSLEQAFRNVKRNRGAAGVDKLSIAMFEANLEQNLQALLRRLQNGTFRPLPLRRVDIPKSPGKTRPIGIPAVRDRVVQEDLRAILSIPFEQIFHEHSYGFRPARSCHMAVRKVLEFYRLGYKYVLDADISGFFDNLPHKVMMDGLTELIADGSILNLIEQFLKAGVIKDGVFHSTRMGTPQGGVISPLLANIALNGLDWRLHNEGFRFVRYADDFVVLAQSEAEVKAAHELVHLESREDSTDDVPRRLRLPGLRHLGPLGGDAPQIRGEIQDSDPRTHATASQPGPRSHPESQRGGPGRRELLRGSLRSCRRPLSRLGPVDSHANPLHEVQT